MEICAVVDKTTETQAIDLLPKTYVYANIIKRNIKMCNKKKALAKIVPTKKVNAFFVYI